jgi:Tetratricopeptide repeat
MSWPGRGYHPGGVLKITRSGKQEACMIRPIRWVILGMFVVALIVAPPVIPAFAAGGADPPATEPPPPAKSAPMGSHKSKSKSKKKGSKQSSNARALFVQGYRTAYETIYDRHDYATAIRQLKALDHDDLADVANLIGYSYRKLGDYRLSQVWYERALKADPNHVRTWQYYGLWQIEQGNRDQALYHLHRIAAICGTDCKEYQSLAAALEKPQGAGLVY